MTRVVLTPEAARTVMEAVIREELMQAWERGLDTAPHSVNALADAGAPQSFKAIMAAVDDLATAIVGVWRGRHGCPPPTPGDVSRETSQPGDTPAGTDQAAGE